MKKRNQSSAAIMSRSMTKLIVGVTITLGILIVASVGHQLLQEVATTTTHIITSLKATDIDGDHDWRNWRRNSTLDTSASYVYVHNERPNAKIKRYLSPNADDILEVDPIKVPLIKNLYYRPGIGLLYHRMGHARGIYYTLWQNMKPQLAVLMRVIQVTTVLLVLTLMITPLYIRRLTKRLTDPLTGLSKTTKVIASAKEPGTMQLPVPESPSEVADLAGNFNELLRMLNDRQEQQKLFVLNAAHELRTPIATIRSHSQLIERHGKDHPEIVDKSVRYITEESRQMQQLINELLQLSRADRLALELSRIDLSDVAVTTVQKLQSTLPQTIALDVAADIQLNGNASAIEQIITNLVTNASKYSPLDSTITVTLIKAAEVAMLTVKDQGRGISDADKAHIFERFYRSDDVRGTVTGTGLGLAIAMQLAKLSNGDITVTDNYPRGTVFRLTLATK